MCDPHIYNDRYGDFSPYNWKSFLVGMQSSFQNSVREEFSINTRTLGNMVLKARGRTNDPKYYQRGL